MYRKQLTDMIMVSLKYFFSIEPYLIHQAALIVFIIILAFRQTLANIPVAIAATRSKLVHITTLAYHTLLDTEIMKRLRHDQA